MQLRQRHLCAGLLLALAALIPTSLGVYHQLSSDLPAAKADNTKVASVRTEKAHRAYRNLPLSFEPNVGQTDSEVRYLSRGKGFGVFLTEDEALIVLHRRERQANPTANRAHSKRMPMIAPTQASVVRVRFAGANPHPRLAGSDPLIGKSNYFVGNNPKDWRTGIPNFSRVTYRNLYDGIDLAFYGNPQKLETDFIVAPGANPDSIAFRIEGGDKAQIDSEGDLQVNTASGPVMLRKPVVYQADGPSRRLVNAVYAIENNGLVRFRLNDYDHAKPLIVDPVLDYSTFLGNTPDDAYTTDGSSGIAVDSNGDAFISGYTYSLSFPTTSGAVVQGPLGSTVNGEAFISELNPSGTALLYSTYFAGNSGTEWASGITLDSANPPNVYVAGVTCSSNFPTTSNAYQGSLSPSCGSFDSQGFLAGSAAFVTEFNPSQSGTASLKYSTYIGGNGSNVPNSITLGPDGSIYVTGGTTSTNFPVTSTAYQSSNAGGNLGNIFLTRIDPTKSGTASLIYSTYLGGSGNSTHIIGDVGLGLAVDSNSNAYIGGYTGSSNFPLTTGALIPSAPTTVTDLGTGFVARIDTTKSGTASLIYSTYLGGNGNGTGSYDTAQNIALGPDRQIFIAGSTTSSNFPVTSGAYQTQMGTDPVYGQGGAFLTVLDTSQTGNASLVYSTFVGSGQDYWSTVAVDNVGNAYVSGTTRLDTYPVTPGAVQSQRKGCFNAVVTEITPSGRGSADLAYSTYLGGSGAGGPNHPELCYQGDIGSAITIDANKNVYVTGYTESSDFLVTSGAYQTSFTGYASMFVSKLSLPTAPSATVASISPASGPVTTPVVITGTGFGATQGNSKVFFSNGATQAFPTDWNDTHITVPVPAGAISGNVVVKIGATAPGINFNVTGNGPFTNGYSYSRTIVIDHTQVPNTDQTNFPIVISGTYPYLATIANSGQVQNANGYDIVFSSQPDGSAPLAFEQESYSASSGAITYWVKVPTLSHTTDTVIYMFYGNSSVTTGQSNRNATWDSNFAAVYHMSDNAANSTVSDSTANDNNGTNQANTNGKSTTGKIGTGLSFNGSSDYTTLPNNASLNITGPTTMSAWVKTSQSQADIIDGYQNGSPYAGYGFRYNGGYLNYWNGSGWAGPGAGTVNNNIWHLVHVSVDGSGNAKFFLDGAQVGTTQTSSDPSSYSGSRWIGLDSPAGLYLNGTLDEIRISNTNRSADWIATEYNNQNGSSSFYTIGSPSGMVPQITSASPISGTVGSLVTIAGSQFGSSQGSSTITFNGTPGIPSDWKNDRILVNVPNNASTGDIVVSVNGVASGPVNFTVIPVPNISSLSASSGEVGKSVGITGVNFGGSEGTSTVTFNGVQAGISTWNDTQILASVPNGATTGNVVVTVGGIASNGQPFTVITGGSWPNGYDYRRTITISQAMVPNTDQTNFPLLLSGTYSYLATTANGGNVTNSSGYDIVFSSQPDGSAPLAFEQESYSGSSGAISYWVKVPTLSHTTDTVIYMFYGNSSVTTDQSNRNGTWDSNFAAVYHMSDNAANATVSDSTANDNNGTNQANTNGKSTAGKIGTGLSFNGSSDYTTLPNNASLNITGPITMSAWVKTSQGQADIIDGYHNGSPYAGYGFRYNGGYLNYWNGSGWAGPGTGTVNNNLWHLVHVSVDASGNAKFFLDGAQVGTTQTSSDPSSYSGSRWIGLDSAAGFYLNGTLDEIRISNTNRSADWIATEYNNQSNPSGFYTIGSGTIGSPNITSLSPNVGTVGTTVIVNGTNFGPVQTTSSGVTFAGIPATSITIWRDTQIVVQVPNAAGNGDVIVTASGVASNGQPFTVTAPPSITTLSPSAGAVTSPVTINGSNFGSSRGSSTVMFNTTPVDPVSGYGGWSDTQIQVNVPSGAQTGYVVVTVSGIASSGVPFTVTTGSGGGTPGVYYYFDDFIGSSKVITDSSGDVCEDEDLYPFGGERPPAVDTCPQNYKFTGKERDQESDLDAFGARYYASGTGRFVSPDWTDDVDPVPFANVGDPQSLNLYGYVRDNPLSLTDFDGHKIVCTSSVTTAPDPNGGTRMVQRLVCHDELDATDFVGHWFVGIGNILFTNQYKAGAKQLVWAYLGDAAAGAIVAGAFSIGGDALQALGRPAWANEAGGFVNWLKNLQGAQTKLTSEQADAIVKEAGKLGVKVRLDPPHLPPNNWRVPHLNIGANGQVHLEVPAGYDNAAVPKGSVSRPK